MMPRQRKGHRPTVRTIKLHQGKLGFLAVGYGEIDNTDIEDGGDGMLLEILIYLYNIYIFWLVKFSFLMLRTMILLRSEFPVTFKLVIDNSHTWMPSNLFPISEKKCNFVVWHMIWHIISLYFITNSSGT